VKEVAEPSLVNNKIWGYGVITPECLLSTQGADPGFSSKIWLDEMGYPEKLTEFVQGLSQYWLEDKISKKGDRKEFHESLPSWDREKLVYAIRPVVAYVEGVGPFSQIDQ